MRILNRMTASAEEIAQGIAIDDSGPLSSPFISDNPPWEDKETLNNYRRYLLEKLSNADASVVQAFRSLRKDSVLICKHAPKECHGHVIVELYEEIQNEGIEFFDAVKRIAKRHDVPVFMYNPEDDGITHINAYSRGKTELGRLLSNFALTPFKIPNYGRFASVEGFWYWLALGQTHNELRSLYGYAAKQTGRAIYAFLTKPPTVNTRDDWFKEQITFAIAAKVLQNQRLKMLLAASELPIVHYYVWENNGKFKVSFPSEFAWISEAQMRMRASLSGKNTTLSHIKPLRLVIAGSRTIEDFTVVREALDKFKLHPTEITSGMANDGVDQLAALYALSIGIPINEMPADWETHGKRAGMIRNGEMADYVEEGLVIWDGISNGSRNMIEQLQRRNKPVHVLNLGKKTP